MRKRTKKTNSLAVLAGGASTSVVCVSHPMGFNAFSVSESSQVAVQQHACQPPTFTCEQVSCHGILIVASLEELCVCPSRVLREVVDKQRSRGIDLKIRLISFDTQQYIFNNLYIPKSGDAREPSRTRKTKPHRNECG
jgi:hypothetical protein